MAWDNLAKMGVVLLDILLGLITVNIDAGVVSAAGTDSNSSGILIVPTKFAIGLPVHVSCILLDASTV